MIWACGYGIMPPMVFGFNGKVSPIVEYVKKFVCGEPSNAPTDQASVHNFESNNT